MIDAGIYNSLIYEMKIEKEIAGAYANRKKLLLPGAFLVDVSNEADQYIRMTMKNEQSYNERVYEIFNSVIE